MWDDAVLMQGRQTKRKWKLVLVLVLTALLLLLAAWTAEHWSQLQDTWREKLLQMTSRTQTTWVSVDYDKNAGAFCLGNTVYYVEPGQISGLAWDGTTKFRWDTGLEKPVYICSGGAAAVYDAGGTELVLLQGDDCRTIPVPGGIDTAAVSDSGHAAVITQGSGYQTLTVQYDKSGNVISSMGDTESAMTMMTYLRDSDVLASCWVTSLGDWVLRIDGADITMKVCLEAELVYDIRPCGRGVALWTDRGIEIFSEAGEMTARAALDPDHVMAWDSDSFAAVLLLRNGQSQLLTISEDGRTWETETLLRPARGLSVCGNTACVLDTEALLFYDKSCTLQEETADGASAMAAQAVYGGAVLFGCGEFMRYMIS